MNYCISYREGINVEYHACVVANFGIVFVTFFLYTYCTVLIGAIQLTYEITIALSQEVSKSSDSDLIFFLILITTELRMKLAPSFQIH